MDCTWFYDILDLSDRYEIIWYLDGFFASEGVKSICFGGIRNMVLAFKLGLFSSHPKRRYLLLKDIRYQVFEELCQKYS